jgi:hypothetical protein
MAGCRSFVIRKWLLPKTNLTEPSSVPGTGSDQARDPSRSEFRWRHSTVEAGERVIRMLADMRR